MIKIKDLVFAYDKEKVLNGIDFRAEKGQLIAVLGKNGAGKSTLFKCILGFLTKYNGEILLDDKEVRTLNRKQIASIAAYIPQSEMPVYNYTVFDTVLMGTTGTLSPLQSPGEEQISTAEDAIRSMGIENLAQRGINDLSGGERQLALLARAIAQKAKLLIMDEPTANLDYGNQHLVMNSIAQMVSAGYTVLLSTHNPEHALQYATHVLAIKDHKVMAFGKATDVLTEEIIDEIYGMKVKIAEFNVNGTVMKSCIPVSALISKEHKTGTHNITDGEE